MSKAWPVPDLDPMATLGENARRILAVRIAEYYSHAPAVAHEDAIEPLHEMRISAKRLRYTLELFREVFGGDGARQLAAIKEIQEALGQIHDHDGRIVLVATELATLEPETGERQWEGGRGGDPRPGLLAMLAREQDERTTAYRRFREVWDRFARDGMREDLVALSAQPVGAFGVRTKGDDVSDVGTDQELDAIAGRVRAAVEELAAEQITFLRELIATPSQTGTEGAVQRLVAERFRGYGLETTVQEPLVGDLAAWAEHVTPVQDYRDRPNVVGVRRGAGDGRSLILNAHIDTVEIGDRTQWARDPLSGEIVDGRLYGRGSCDMKGGLASNLFALLALERAGFRPRGDVILQSVISEEDGGAGALAAVLAGPRADAAIISEPTRRAVVPAQGGSLMFRIHLTGRSAHACVRDEGHSAIESWAVVHRGLLAFEARRNREIDHPLYQPISNKIPINVGTLRSGSWPSSVPEWLVAEGRAGMVPGEHLENFKTEFLAEVDRIADADPWLADHRPRVEWMEGQFAAAGIDAGHPLVETVKEAHRATDGAEPPVEAVTYGADLRHFVLAGGMPCVMYGAGDVRLAHAPDESIPLDELQAATATLAVAIARWCGVEEVN
jgi:acetylornithine deacetylase